LYLTKGSSLNFTFNFINDGINCDSIYSYLLNDAQLNNFKNRNSEYLNDNNYITKINFYRNTQNNFYEIKVF
jgi:hypothetical protein